MHLSSSASAESEILCVLINLILKELHFVGERSQLFYYSGIVCKLAVESCTRNAGNVLEIS